MNTAEALSYTAPDGRKIHAQFWSAQAPVAVLVMAPALGIPARYYAAFCSYLATQGFSGLCLDYRGIGDSRADDDRQIHLRDWGEQDLEGAFREMHRRYPDLPLLHIGHSVGAQLMALSPMAAQIRASAFIAVSSPHWRHWHGGSRWKIWLLFRVLIPLLCIGRTSFPARKLGLSSANVPAGVIRQWAGWSHYREYLFDPRTGSGARGERLHCPLLSVQFSDDAYATPEATRAILRGFPAARVETRAISPDDYGLKGVGHLGFFKAQHTDKLWPMLASWLHQQAQEKD